jgi:hypothetical protein
VGTMSAEGPPHDIHVKASIVHRREGIRMSQR